MLIVVIRMNYIVFGISLRIQLVLDTEALAACLGGLKCQGDVEAEELSKLVMEHCHFEPGIYDEYNWIWKPENHGFFDKMEGDLRFLMEKHLKLWRSMRKTVMKHDASITKDWRHFVLLTCSSAATASCLDLSLFFKATMLCITSRLLHMVLICCCEFCFWVLPFTMGLRLPATVAIWLHLWT